MMQVDANGAPDPMIVQVDIARSRIKDTIARYNIAGDKRDLDAFVATFCEDAIYESAVFSCAGANDIRQYLLTAWKPVPAVPSPRFRRHHITTTQIDVHDAQQASGRVYYLMVTDLGLDHCGYYLDRYRPVGDRWLIAHRQVWMDWSLPQSLFVPDKSKALVEAGGASGPPGGELPDFECR